MKKYILILNIAVFSCFLLLSPSYSKDLELVVKGAECLKDNKILIKYSVVNNRDFDRQNTSILFKIVEDDKPFACKELKTLIPKGEDGSKIYETTIEVPCKDRNFNVESTIYQYVKRYRIDEYLKGCPKQE
ncbi:MAG TPA: hypothetical protein VJ373_04540 [Desulfatiglandales bacterium]|nr:hypothetical protein [Desulfatiglandales bacterium]